MATTVNKGYELQTTGTNAGTWGGVLNSSVFEIVDRNLGGIVTKSLSSSPVTLSSTESQNALLRLTGTLSAAVEITTSAIGFFFVENLTTGSYAVTVRNSSVSTAATIPQGTRAALISDASNGVRIAASDGFLTGTAMLFAQSAAPVGWTKSTTHNDKALRVVSGTASSGGSLAFSSAFATGRTLTGSVAGYTLTIADMPAHTHTVTNKYAGPYNFSGGSGLSRDYLVDAARSPAGDQATPPTSSSTGGGGSHTHAAGTLAVDMAVQYVDVIIATKD